MPETPVPPASAAARPPAGGTPEPGLVVVRWATADLRSSDLEGLTSELDADTRRRIDALARPEDRRRGIAGHALMRLLVGEVLGQAPAEVRVERHCLTCGAADHGKPVLATPPGAAGPPLQFNLAHSGDCVAVALADPSTAVGIDVETIRPDFDWAPTRRHVFTDEDWATSGAAPDATTARFGLWARKEAVVKCTGHGLAVDLARAEVDPLPRADGARRARLRAPEGVHELLVADVGLLPGTAAAVAVPATVGARLQVQVERVDLSDH